MEELETRLPVFGIRNLMGYGIPMVDSAHIKKISEYDGRTYAYKRPQNSSHQGTQLPIHSTEELQAYFIFIGDYDHERLSLEDHGHQRLIEA